MTINRCDVCCNVLDDIDGGVVYECSSKVYNKISLEHICKDCLEADDEF